MYKELFKFEKGEVVPLTSREATIKEVKAILTRDKGSPGDADGRKKLQAYRELGAVYWIADYRSPGRMNGYEGDALVQDAIRNFGLDATWQPDKVVNNLIKLYEYNSEGGIAAEVLTELAGTFRIMLETIKVIREKLRIKLAIDGITEDELRGLIGLQSDLLKLTADIPKKIKEIEAAKELLKATEHAAEIARGGQPITSSMIPDKE